MSMIEIDERQDDEHCDQQHLEGAASVDAVDRGEQAVEHPVGASTMG